MLKLPPVEDRYLTPDDVNRLISFSPPWLAVLLPGRVAAVGGRQQLSDVIQLT